MISSSDHMLASKPAACDRSFYYIMNKMHIHDRSLHCNIFMQFSLENFAFSKTYATIFALYLAINN